MQELIFGLIGGTALLMYGVDKMGDGLEKASGEMMRKILSVLTGRVWGAFLVGTLLTALVQSSTAITVLTVGFVNAGLMKLPQAVGIIYGANIGTTITAQLMAFSFSFKLTEIALPVLGIGFAISYLVKNKTLKNVGDALMGFGMMFLGLKILNQGIPLMQQSEVLRYFFQHYASIAPVGILLGALATALVHSSSATVGLVMVLGQAGLIDLQTAVCIMLGDNIGTCITAQLASLTGNINARRTAWAHTLYNIIGVAVVALVLPLFVDLIKSTTLYLQPDGGISSQIANSHTLFNVVSAVVFLPLTKFYVKFLETVIRSRKKREQGDPVYLDKLLLDTPVAAIRASLSEITRGAEIARGMVNKIMDAFYNNDGKNLDTVEKDEEAINSLQKDITSYIIDITKNPLTDSQSAMIPLMINGINNIERVGDHATDMMELARVKIEKGLKFSADAIDEIRGLHMTIDNMFDSAIKMLQHKDPEIAPRLIEMENTVDAMTKSLLDNHMIRLENRTCNIESGVIYSDMINYFERVADHIYKLYTLTENTLQLIPENEGYKAG